MVSQRPSRGGGVGGGWMKANLQSYHQAPIFEKADLVKLGIEPSFVKDAVHQLENMSVSHANHWVWSQPIILAKGAHCD